MRCLTDAELCDSRAGRGRTDDAVVRHASRTACERMVPALPRWRTRVNKAVQHGDAYEALLRRLGAGADAMLAVTHAVQEQRDNLSQNASRLLMREAKLELVYEELGRVVHHFTHMDDLCHEAGDVTLSARSARFPVLVQELAAEMSFLSCHTDFQSARPYAGKLSVAMQRVTACLKEAVVSSFDDAVSAARGSEAYAQAMQSLNEPRRWCASTERVAEGAALAGDEHATKELTSQQHNTKEEEEGKEMTMPNDTHRLAGPDMPAAHMPDVSRMSRSDVVVGASVSSDRHSAANDASTRSQACRVSHFREVLRAVNAGYLAKLRECASLRRMVELREGMAYTGAEAFGEEPLTSPDADVQLREILAAYRDTRDALMSPVMQRWLKTWQLSAGDAEMNTAEELPSAGDGAQLKEAASKSSSSNSNSNDTIIVLPLSSATAYRLPHMTAHICELLEVALEEEQSVLDEVWLRADIVTLLLPQLMANTADTLYHLFRAHLVRVDSVVELTSTIETIHRVLLRQSSGDATGGATTSTAAGTELWVRMIQDAQERAIFRTSVYLRNRIARITPEAEVVAYYAHEEDAATTRARRLSRRDALVGGAGDETNKGGLEAVTAQEEVGHTPDLVESYPATASDSHAGAGGGT